MANNKAKNECECGVWIDKSDMARYELWQRILEQEKPFVHIKSLVAGRSKNGLYYRGDPERLTQTQRDNLVEMLADRFGIPHFIIRSDLKKGNLPILAKDTSIWIGRCHTMLLL